MTIQPNLLAEMTPWPWEISKCKEGSVEIQTPLGAIGEVYYNGEDDEGESLDLEQDKEALAVATLWTLAPDHALLLAALVAGKARIIKDDYGLRVDNLLYPKWHENDAQTDPFCCPILTPELRTALRKALGLETTCT